MSKIGEVRGEGNISAENLLSPALLQGLEKNDGGYHEGGEVLGSEAAVIQLLLLKLKTRIHGLTTLMGGHSCSEAEGIGSSEGLLQMP